MKRTKHKLISSIATLFICFAMLIGSTYAWFTDTASTGVNRIQAGNLDIQLLNEDGTASIEGRTLNWTKAAGVSEDVLWEPGATYYTEGFQIKNGGNLALKFKISINGITGDADLLRVIDFYLTDSVPLDREQQLGTVLPLSNAEYKLNPNQYWNTSSGSDYMTTVRLVGHMREEAGNEYQGKTLDNIGITLTATQDSVENDSFDQFYDEFATYPVVPTLNNYTKTGNVTKTDGGILGNDADPAKISIPENAVDEDKNAKFSMILTETKPDSVTYEISLKEITSSGTETDIELSKPATVTADIGRNLINVNVVHNTTPMDEATDPANEEQDGYFKYDRNSGIVTIWTISFSPFTFFYEFDGVASLNGDLYPSINSAINAATSGDTIKVLRNFETDSVAISVIDGKKVTIDLQGHQINGGKIGVQTVQIAFDGSQLIVKNGEISADDVGIFVMDSAKLILENVVINASDVGVFSQENNNSITIDGCMIKSNYYGVYQNGSKGGNTFVIRGSTISDNNDEGAGIYISGQQNQALQSLTVENSTITGKTAIEVKHTDVIVTGSTLNSTQENISYDRNENNGNSTSGYCLAITSNGISDLTRGTITLSDNTYNPANPGCDIFDASSGNGATINGYDNTHILSPDKLLPVCRIQGANTVFYSAYDLRNATAATLKNKTVVIQSDEVLNDEIYLSGKAFTLDLNGHSLSLEYGNGVKPNNGSTIYIGGKNSKLTITDSSEEQTGSVYGSNKTYANKVTSAVRVGNYGKLIINGGKFYGTSEATSCIFVYTSRASTSATVTINGGYFETASPSGGIYFVLNHEDGMTRDCKITVNGGKFKNFNPGVTQVDPVNAYTGKIVLGTGCETTEETVENDTYYVVSK